MKQYNGEKAIISLTSWKARINTVGLTLFSLYKRCPGFHIVLVLSEEEFPKKEAELPDSENIKTFPLFLRTTTVSTFATMLKSYTRIGKTQERKSLVTECHRKTRPAQ